MTKLPDPPLWVVATLLVLFIALLLAAVCNTSESRPVPATDTPAPAAAATPPPNQLWEGRGNITLGCSLWEDPQQRPFTDDEYQTLRRGDFYMQGDTEELILVVVGVDGVFLLTGRQCGMSIDWRAFPVPRVDGN